MKFKTFESLLQNCIDLYNRGVEQDKKLSSAFGGDSEITQDWWGYPIDDILNSIELEFCDKEERVQWLFWESMLNMEEYADFEIDGIVYEGSPENIWMELKGILNEQFSKSIPFETNKFTKEEIVEAHDEKKIKEIDMTHLVPGDNPWQSSVIQESDKDKEIESNNVPEIKTEQFKKRLLLKDKQIELESKKYSEILEKKVNILNLFNDNIAMDTFETSLNKIFESLLLDTKHKDTLTDMNNKIRMVLLQFTTEPINEEIASMINFEIQKVFNNLKEFKNIFDYKVEKADIKEDYIRIEGNWLWEDIGEREKLFSIDIGEEIKIDFK